MDVAAYLRRIEYAGATAPSSALLRDLHRQHLFTVPFENLDIALRTPILLDHDALFDKIVTGRRGGFCYELNSLFRELLLALGFEVEMLSARVRREDGGFGPEFDHMLLAVALQEPWLADVGFGECFVDPLPFRSGAVEVVNGYRYRVEQDGDDWQLLREDSKGQVPLYRFTERPRRLSDFEPMSLYHQTSPESHFTHNQVCSKALPDGRITLSGMRLILTRKGVREETVLKSESEVRQCLREHFGFEFPENVVLYRASA